jgi:hypothetical protein
MYNNNNIYTAVSHRRRGAIRSVLLVGAPDRVTLGSFGPRLAESTTCRLHTRESSMAAVLKLLLHRHSGQWCTTVLLQHDTRRVAMVTTAGESITAKQRVFVCGAARRRAQESDDPSTGPGVGFPLAPISIPTLFRYSCLFIFIYLFLRVLWCIKWRSASRQKMTRRLFISRQTIAVPDVRWFI